VVCYRYDLALSLSCCVSLDYNVLESSLRYGGLGGRGLGWGEPKNRGVQLDSSSHTFPPHPFLSHQSAGSVPGGFATALRRSGVERAGHGKVWGGWCRFGCMAGKQGGWGVPGWVFARGSGGLSDMSDVVAISFPAPRLSTRAYRAPSTPAAFG
jgi:hypothetical protein